MGLAFLGAALPARGEDPDPDAGVAAPADAGPISGLALDLRRQSEQIRAFLAGRLALDVDPASLFDVAVEAPEGVMQLEAERLERLLRADGFRAGSDGAGGELGEGSDPRTWRARLELDRARLEFYSLPLQRRVELVRDHGAQRQQAVASSRTAAVHETEREARRAEEQQLLALEAARRARTEAARLVNEEHARLLAITKLQAEYESTLIQRRARLDTRSERALGWRRRVAELLAGPLNGEQRSLADQAYVELRSTLRDARSLLSTALDQIGVSAEEVPQPGPDPLADLPPEVERGVAREQRQRVVQKALVLTSEARELEAAETRQLMSEVETLNRLRLDLLASLSPREREGILGFGPRGWDQASSEARQVMLTLRYHLRAAYDWLIAIQRGQQRGNSAWLVLSILAKWAPLMALFVWWRRRADAELERWRRERREKVFGHGEGSWRRFDYAERGLSFLQRVRRPLEWLLLVGLITWAMPDEVAGLLEVQLATTILFWIFGGRFFVLAIDALSSDRSRAAGHGPSTPPLDTAQIRLRSLRLVGRATVTFGLILSLSDLLVGQGTVYRWVFSTCWFAAVPIFLVIIAWWRPFIFARFARVRRPNAFEGWVLANGAPPAGLLDSIRSSVAAVSGGVYLFVLGTLRTVRGRVLTFELTRRLLAYLFRRDLSKKARSSAVVEHAQLPAEAFRTLGPETHTGELISTGAEVQLRQLIQRIESTAGGAIAVVGERGAGKTTIIERLVKRNPHACSLPCSPSGLVELRARLNALLGLDAGSELEVAARSLDARGAELALLIDDAQHLLRPMMGGLSELDQLLSLLRLHSRNCTWVLAFDESVWPFVERSRGGQPAFDSVIQLSPWSEDAIVQLITSRNHAADIKPDFSGLATDLPTTADEVDIHEAMTRTEASYYRLLWDYASGNPGVALHFWRRSLGVSSSGKVLVHLFDTPDISQLEALPDSAAFVLRALVQLGWARAESLREVTALPMARVQDALRFGRQRGYFDVDGEAYSVNWDWFRAVTRFLQRRHLLSSPT